MVKKKNKIVIHIISEPYHYVLEGIRSRSLGLEEHCAIKGSFILHCVLYSVVVLVVVSFLHLSLLSLSLLSPVVVLERVMLNSPAKIIKLLFSPRAFLLLFVSRFTRKSSHIHLQDSGS